MSDLIKIDKRSSQNGYCLQASSGILTINQGGDGVLRTIFLDANELEQFLADVDWVVNQMAQAQLKKVG